MLVNYDELQQKITDEQKGIYGLTILDNPYIPVDPYREQALTIMDDSAFKLISGSAFSGKSMLLAILAVQYLTLPDYRCVIMRNTYDQLMAPGGVMDTLKDWLLQEEDITDSRGNIVQKGLGDLTCTFNQRNKCFISPMGGRIYYDFANRPGVLNKFRGNTYQRIIVDEGTELDPEILDFLPRSLRRDYGVSIPLNYIIATNPSLSRGREYIKPNFVDDNSPNPYFRLDFKMNPHIRADEYDAMLSRMSPLQQAFMRYGDWDFVLDEGLLLTRKQFEDATIKETDYDCSNCTYGVVGVDLAATGSDKTSITYMMYMNDGKIVIQDNILISDSFVEEPLIQFIERQPLVHTVVFEKEGGSAAEYSKKHFENVLFDVQQRCHFFIEFSNVTENKFERARPLARGIRQEHVLIRHNLENYNTLLKQFMYVTPDKTKMREFASPDMLDSCTIGFNYLNQLLGII